MKKLNDLQAFVYVSIISADNDEFGLSEDNKQEIMARYNESKDDPNWAYILECMPDEKQKRTMIKFFSHEEPIQDKTLEPSEEGPKEC